MTKVVDSAAPFQSITELEIKLLPFTVNVNAGPPAVALFGLNDVMTGGGNTVKVKAFEVTPFDTTVT